MTTKTKKPHYIPTFLSGAWSSETGRSRNRRVWVLNLIGRKLHIQRCANVFCESGIASGVLDELSCELIGQFEGWRPEAVAAAKQRIAAQGSPTIDLEGIHSIVENYSGYDALVRIRDQKTTDPDDDKAMASIALYHLMHRHPVAIKIHEESAQARGWPRLFGLHLSWSIWRDPVKAVQKVVGIYKARWVAHVATEPIILLPDTMLSGNGRSRVYVPLSPYVLIEIMADQKGPLTYRSLDPARDKSLLIAHRNSFIDIVSRQIVGPSRDSLVQLIDTAEFALKFDRAERFAIG